MSSIIAQNVILNPQGKVKLMKKNILFLLFFIFALNMGCSTKRAAKGKENRIIVVADSLLYIELKPQLTSIFEREVRTPWAEKSFELEFIPGRKLSHASIQHNVIMIGLLDKPDVTSKQIAQMLNPELVEKVRRNETYVFRKENPWAKGQLLLVLAGESAEQLQGNLKKNADYLFSIMHDKIIEKTSKTIYSRYEQTELADSLMQKYGFRLRIPHDYHFFQDIPQNNFVHFRRINPERWIYVHWVETDDPTVVLDKAWFFKKRAEIGRLHYENDVIVDTLYQFSETEIAGRWALQFQGLWENTKKVAGGAMKAFIFYDENTHRAYIIDIAIYAPSRKNKLVYLNQLEAIARTFRTREDLLAEQK